jgi:Uma2 family endonuclease
METITKTLLTANDLYRLADHGGRNELVRGEVAPMSPASTKHGEIVFDLGFQLGVFVKANNLGKLYAAETGFTLMENPDTVRAPDIAFVAQARIPSGGIPETGFWAIAPDLVVEVISPYDRASDVQDKMKDYLVAGVRLVWLVDPHSHTVTVYKSLDQVKVLLEEDTLDGGDVLPGFSLPLTELFR